MPSIERIDGVSMIVRLPAETFRVLDAERAAKHPSYRLAAQQVRTHLWLTLLACSVIIGGAIGVAMIGGR